MQTTEEQDLYCYACGHPVKEEDEECPSCGEGPDRFIKVEVSGA